MEKKWRTVIDSKSGLLDMDVKEIWKYRDLCLTFIRKNYITKYKQTVFRCVLHDSVATAHQWYLLPWYLVRLQELQQMEYRSFSFICQVTLSGVSFQVVYLRIIIYLATMHISWGRCISQGL